MIDFMLLTLLCHSAPAVQRHKVLVTGGAGFIGSHVAKDCRRLGHEVVVVDDLSGGFMDNVPAGVRFVKGDLKNASFVSALMERERFEIVYHLAAYAAEGLSHFIRNYNYQNNLVASTNLITQSVRVQTVRRFVFTSSIAVYGSGRTPMTEDMDPRPEDPYGISKYAVEMDLKAAHEMFGLDYVIFRPHNVYGPGQNMYDRYRNVIGIFMHELHAGKNLTVFGDGTQTRKFSYIKEVSYPIALAGTLENVGREVFNVGGDIATTVNELAEATKAVWGNPTARVEHLDARNEVAHAESSHHKLNQFFPMLETPIGLRKGLQAMVHWAKAKGKDFPPVEFEAVEVKKNMPPSWVTPTMVEVPALVHKERVNRDNPDGQSVFVNKAYCGPQKRTPYPLSLPLHNWHDSTSNARAFKPRTLVSLHTAMGAWNMTELMLVSLAATHDDFDLILVDDHSDFDIPSVAERWGIKVLRWGNRANGPKGNTHTWNLAWQYALKQNYAYLIIANNDLLVADGTINALSRALGSGEWGALIPKVSQRGSSYKYHSLKIKRGVVEPWTDQPLHYQRVADALYTGKPHIQDVTLTPHRMNGYFMAFNVKTFAEFQYDKNNQMLFDPKKINIGNEDELFGRAHRKTKLGVHNNAFVFHFKGYTIGKHNRDALKKRLGQRSPELFG